MAIIAAIVMAKDTNAGRRGGATRLFPDVGFVQWISVAVLAGPLPRGAGRRSVLRHRLSHTVGEYGGAGAGSSLGARDGAQFFGGRPCGLPASSGKTVDAGGRAGRHRIIGGGVMGRNGLTALLWVRLPEICRNVCVADGWECFQLSGQLRRHHVDLGSSIHDSTPPSGHSDGHHFGGFREADSLGWSGGCRDRANHWLCVPVHSLDGAGCPALPPDGRPMNWLKQLIDHFLWTDQWYLLFDESTAGPARSAAFGGSVSRGRKCFGLIRLSPPMAAGDSGSSKS